MITVKFFASLREKLAVDHLELNVAGSAATVAQLQAELCDRGATWRDALSGPQVLTAVNQAMAKPDHLLQDGDEVAFFPPVTGG